MAGNSLTTMLPLQCFPCKRLTSFCKFPVESQYLPAVTGMADGLTSLITVTTRRRAILFALLS